MRAPYFRIYIGTRDISQFVEGLSYEDAVDEDNLVVMAIDYKYAMTLADDADFATGKMVKFQFGFMGEQVSELHKARITDVAHKYRERVTMNVKCLDLGTVVKKSTSQKIWKNLTSSEIAQEIAADYGLEAEVIKTVKKWANIPQGNKSDLDFLKYLAAREEGGNFITFIRNGTLYFTNRSIKEESRVTFAYAYGDGAVVSFDPTVKESSQSSKGVKTSATYIDPKSGAVAKEDVDNKTETKTGTTGNYKVYYGETGKLKGTQRVGKPDTQPVADKTEATNLANHSKKKASLEGVTAKLVIEGNPLITPNCVITMKNVAKKHLGNWYVKKVSHSIKGGSYTTTLDLAQNGSKIKPSSTAEKTADANTTVGADKAKDEVKLRVYKGEDGKYVKYSSTSTTAKK